MISANLATIKSRSGILKIAVESLRSQVDKIRIYANDYKPEIDGVEVYTGEDLTDRGKFAFIRPGEIYLSCDDDLWYPKDYVQTILKGLKKYPSSYLTFHGRKLQGKGVNYYHAHQQFHFAGDVHGDHLIEVPGTGVSAFNTDKFTPDILSYHHQCMADLLMARECARLGVSVVCLSHKAGWIKMLPAADSIYLKERSRPVNQSKMADEIYEMVSG